MEADETEMVKSECVNSKAAIRRDGESTLGTKAQMLFYGVACVLFWSVLLIQLPFIKDSFGGVPTIFYVPLVYGLASNVSRIVIMWFHSRSIHPTRTKLSHMIYSGAAVTALGMFSLPVALALLPTAPTSLGFWICMVITGVVGIFNSLLVSGGFALMALAPRGTGQFYLLGLTATGIVTWPLMMLLRHIAGKCGAGDDTSFVVAAISLSLTGVLCLSAIAVYRWCTLRNAFFKDQLEAQRTEPDRAGLVATFRMIWVPTVALWWSRMATFALYPGMLGLWSPSSSAYGKSEYQSFLIYMGPLSDTVGQLVYRYSRLSRMIGVKGLVILTAVRSAVIIPLFLVSAWYDGSDSVVSADWFRCLLMFGFSFTMGINYSAGNAIAPRQVSSTDEKFTVGVILSFVAMNGLFVGSLVGVGFKQLLEKHS
jgi:hypothetical protein